ncbi:hypothetical protein OE88DRAFT_1668316 [Heliocybe sulcata]|uniref:Myb-like domain-containing protein n=1 Tax=Heliocybe sulcata TaxID=5364 RepID=A0A5C3MLE8_9AGAM|nr:hypothetical protein OE88DRAFT_1668316 [Heliocybe sulcata]
MDHPQYYQPLSHALNPVSTSNRSPQYQNYNSHAASASGASHAANGAAAEEDEEEEEDVVEEELSGNTRRNADASTPVSPEIQTRQTGPTSGGTVTQAPVGQQPQPQAQVQPPEPPKPVPDPSSYAKRRPGRPKGSKTKKAQQTEVQTTQAPTYSSYYAYQTPVHAPLHPTGPGSAPPLHPSVNEHNQQYYEFQWRVLNLCAEFYGAAEELVSKTPALVLAQCYGLGTTSPVDPLAILTEAKRNCDLLLANPSALLTHPPPPMYPIMPMYAPYPQPAPAAPQTVTPTATTSQAATTTAAATNPTTAASTTTTNNSSRYPTAPYYQYAGPYQPATQATYYTTTSTTGSASATIANPSLSAGAGGGPATGGNSGTWSDEETERLKRLAEQSKTTGGSGDIEWDWVINQWGNSRTRHQILIKATNLGLKESSGRGVKRRRETESGTGGTASPAPAPASTNDTSGPPASSTSTFQVSVQPAASASPAGSTPASTQPSPALHHPQPQISPVMQNVQPPASSNPSAHHLPWPMPTVASTNSPVIAAASTEAPRQSYYRPRPNQSPSMSTAKPPSSSGAGVNHQYMYQSSGGQRK